MPEHKSLLPRVEEEDLLDLIFEDVVEPSHQERWGRIASANSRLAREVLKRSAIAAREERNEPERQKAIIDILTFAIEALERAAIRTSDHGNTERS